jgi:hypothetical protein
VRRFFLGSLCIGGLGACAAPLAPPVPAPSIAPDVAPEVASSVTPVAAPIPSVPSESPATSIAWLPLATSVEGRAIRAATLGHGPRRVVWVGGIHGDEREGSCATAELPAAFLAEPGAAERVTLIVIEDLNPDGSERKTRANAHGVDLNRNFPAASFRTSRRHGREPMCEPESRALGELVASWRPALVLVAHSFRGAEFVNFDGPAHEVAERFAERTGLELRASDALEPTPGSFGTWAGVELGVAVLTLEFRCGAAPEAAWAATRAAILAAVLDD